MAGESALTSWRRHWASLRPSSCWPSGQPTARRRTPTRSGTSSTERCDFRRRQPRRIRRSAPLTRPCDTGTGHSRGVHRCLSGASSSSSAAGLGLPFGVAVVGNGKRREGGVEGTVSSEGGGPSVDPQCALCTGELSPGWVLTYVDGDPATEGTREVLLALGNGYLATRGAAPESTADGTHYPGTYAAGVYNRLVSVVEGREREDESVVNLPNWLVLTFRPAGGEWCAPGSVRRIHEHQALDLRTGVYRRELVVADRQDRRTRLRQRRLVSMAAAHLAAMETTVTPLNWSGLVWPVADPLRVGRRGDERERRHVRRACRPAPGRRRHWQRR